jgi:uncharacterized protein involved in type VI secretion and phage assembly
MFQNINSGVPVIARALVVANQDPDHLGRVRVTYPWLGHSNSQGASNWASVCMSYASKEGGAYCLPEKGDEVLVGFENGNLDSPVIIGSIYSKKTQPPASGRKDDFNSSGRNALRYVKTRSGHLLCFDDSEDEGGIVIKDQENRRFEIQSMKKKVILSDENENQIVLDGSKITIESKGNRITVDSSGVIIQSAGKIHLGEGASEALLKGNTFLSLFNAHVHPTAMGPSGPPLVPLSPAVLSLKVKTE